MIEPVLRRLLNARMKVFKGARMKAPRCQTELFMQIDARGNFVKMEQTMSCADAGFNGALREAFESFRGLPPPPSNLLENGMVELIWGLTVR